MKEYVLVSREDLFMMAEYAARRAAEEKDPKKKFITRTEIIEEIGRAKFDWLVENGKLNVIKQGGRTATVKALRTHYNEIKIKNYLT